MLSTVRKIVEKVYNELSFEKKNDTFFSDIARSEIETKFAAQKKADYGHVNNVYRKAGFGAENITSMIVQNQLARG